MNFAKRNIKISIHQFFFHEWQQERPPFVSLSCSNIHPVCFYFFLFLFFLSMLSSNNMHESKSFLRLRQCGRSYIFVDDVLPYNQQVLCRLILFFRLCLHMFILIISTFRTVDMTILQINTTISKTGNRFLRCVN